MAPEENEGVEARTGVLSILDSRHGLAQHIQFLGHCLVLFALGVTGLDHRAEPLLCLASGEVAIQDGGRLLVPALQDAREDFACHVSLADVGDSLEDLGAALGEHHLGIVEEAEALNLVQILHHELDAWQLAHRAEQQCVVALQHSLGLGWEASQIRVDEATAIVLDELVGIAVQQLLQQHCLVGVLLERCPCLSARHDAVLAEE